MTNVAMTRDLGDDRSARAEDLRVGMRVRVNAGAPDRLGQLGKVEGGYGHRDHRALEVRFADGLAQLLWRHQLGEAEQQERPA